jgi:endoglycosylceramidase
MSSSTTTTKVLRIVVAVLFLVLLTGNTTAIVAAVDSSLQVNRRFSASNMTGVNMTLWDASDTRYKQAYFGLLKQYNVSYVMLNFGWNKLEPQKGVYNQSYLGEMDRFITKAKSAGIRIILRMHKYAYPNAYQAQQPGNIWILGYPAWINATPDFWENVDNCQANYVAMWTMLATRYKNEPYVVGFELFSEPGTDIGPGIYDPINASWQDWSSNTARKVMAVLFDKDKLYERTINAIHAITDKLVIIESFVGGSISYIKNVGDTQRTVPSKPDSWNFAVGQSVYEPYQFNWLDGQKNITNAWGVPLLATEFGVEVTTIASPLPDQVSWVQQACQAFGARSMGWFYWEFGPGPDGDYNLVHATDDIVSPILTNTLSAFAEPLT